MSTPKPVISAIAAMSENRVIGIDNALPWHIPEDMKHFRDVTRGKPVIMGRKTFESIGRPLPGRTNIVISRSGYSAEGITVTTDLESALAAARETGAEEIMIIGGAQIYALALPVTTRVYLTVVHTEIEGDAFFPDLPANEWQETANDPHDGDPAFSFKVFEKREMQK